LGGACSTYGGEDRYITGFWQGNLKDHLENPGLDGRIIFRWIFRKWDGRIDSIDLAQYRDSWRALANAVMNLWIP
jgi:hypothetical protein